MTAGRIPKRGYGNGSFDSPAEVHLSIIEHGVEA